MRVLERVPILHRLAPLVALLCVGCSETIAPPDESSGGGVTRVVVTTSALMPGEWNVALATAFNARGEAVDDATFTWTVSHPLRFVAGSTSPSPGVSPRFEAVAAGAGTISAEVNGVFGGTQVSVETHQAVARYAHLLPGDTTQFDAFVPRFHSTTCCGTLFYNYALTIDSLRTAPGAAVSTTGRSVTAVSPGIASVQVFVSTIPAVGSVEVLGEPAAWASFLALSRSSGLPCGISSDDGRVVCWGGGVSTRAGAPADRGRSRELDLGSDITRLTGNVLSHVCGLTAEGALRCQGRAVVEEARRWIDFQLTDNGIGPLACGILADSSAACQYGAQIKILESSPKLRAMSLSGRLLCGVAGDSTAHCWSLASNDTPAWATALALTGLPPVRAVSTNQNTICWLAVDESAWCGATLPSPPAVGASARIEGVPPIIGVAAGNPSYLLTASGTVLEVPAGLAPVPVENASGLTTIWNAGAGATCGLRVDFSAWCWGPNIGGAVGDGTAVPRRAAQRVRASY